jgi:hypothetical protein
VLEEIQPLEMMPFQEQGMSLTDVLSLIWKIRAGAATWSHTSKTLWIMFGGEGIGKTEGMSSLLNH